MIMILLVTAYTGMVQQGRRGGNNQWLHPELQQILPSASRAHCPAGVPAGLAAVVRLARHLLSGPSDGADPPRHALPILPATPCRPPRHVLLVVHVIRHRIAAAMPPAAGDRPAE